MTCLSMRLAACFGMVLLVACCLSVSVSGASSRLGRSAACRGGASLEAATEQAQAPRHPPNILPPLPVRASLAPTTSFAGLGVCGSYPLQVVSFMEGNEKRQYPVVKIQAKDLADPTSFAKSGRESDNMAALPTICAFTRMQAAAALQGVALKINSAFRCIARQTYFRNCYETKKCNNGNFAMPIGTSNHGFGLALDIALSLPPHNGFVVSWLVARAHEFGFVRTVPAETWHWEYRPTEPRAAFTEEGVTRDQLAQAVKFAPFPWK